MPQCANPKNTNVQDMHTHTGLRSIKMVRLCTHKSPFSTILQHGRGCLCLSTCIFSHPAPFLHQFQFPPSIPTSISLPLSSRARGTPCPLCTLLEMTFPLPLSSPPMNPSEPAETDETQHSSLDLITAALSNPDAVRPDEPSPVPPTRRAQLTPLQDRRRHNSGPPPSRSAPRNSGLPASGRRTRRSSSAAVLRRKEGGNDLLRGSARRSNGGRGRPLRSWN